MRLQIRACLVPNSPLAFQQRSSPSTPQRTDGSSSGLPDEEREFGGLSHAARRRLREVAASLRTDKPSQERPDSAPQTGTRLLRVWRGETHEVVATGNGYEYRGQTYSSLSKIAREITGTRWSGPPFFGVRKPWLLGFVVLSTPANLLKKGWSSPSIPSTRNERLVKPTS